MAGRRFLKVTVFGLAVLVVCLYLTSKILTPGKLRYVPYRVPVTDVRGSFSLSHKAAQYPTEAELLATPEATGSHECADAGRSHMVLLSGSLVKLGDEIRVRVDVFRVDGKPRSLGGDEVRIWLRDNSVQASAAGYVIDLKNGSYVGVLRPMWSGHAEVVAAIAAPREKARGLYRLYRKYNTLRDILVEYRSGHVSQRAFCAPSLPLPGYRHACNLTAENYGSSWYCGKPSKAGLLCNDWMMVAPGNHTAVFSNLEMAIIPLFHRRLPLTLLVEVEGDRPDAKIEPAITCRERPLFETWGDHSPVGFFHRGLWNPRYCRNDGPLTSSLHVHTPCLRHRRVLLFGDSTMRYVLYLLVREFGLSIKGEKGGHYHRPTSASNADLKLSVHWLLHEQPYFTGGGEFFRGHNRAFSAYLDELPSTSTDIVFMHMYQHLTPFHPDVFRSRVRRLSHSVKALLDRAPNVSVAVKGSHTYHHVFGTYTYAHSDYWGKLYDQIWKEEFSPLHDRVLFLDVWDMTLAMENADPHPPEVALRGMLKTLLSYVCGR